MRLALLALLIPLTAACSGTTHDVPWRITFSHGVPTGAIVVHAEIRQGSCSGTALVAYDIDLTTHAATATLAAMNLSSGTYCVYAEARDSGCGAVGASAMVSFVLPTAAGAEIVVDILAVTPGTGACPGMCVAGHCPTPDAGTDAGVRDSSSDMPSSDVPIVPMDMTGVDMTGVDLGDVDMPITGMDLGMPDMFVPPTCDGCMTSTTCNAGIGNASCGSGGGACDVCGASEECIDQVCVTRSAHFVESPLTTMLLRADGNLYSAGDDAYMERGTRSVTSPMFSFEELTPLPAGMIVSVGATQFATCAVGESGRLYCWGTNGYGLLGRGMGDPTIATATPTAVGGSGGLVTWVAIDGGTQHFCAMHADGALLCWGDGTHGQLGLGATMMSATSPTRVGTATWVQVSAGDVHTCAVRSDHQLFCWGDNAYGQLGIGSTTASFVPVMVASPTGMLWRSVSVEGTHSCAIDVGGHLYCWGDHRFGQLGISGLSANVLSPQLVGVVADTWNSVSAGQYHTCAIQHGGGGYCWGSNAPYGELGEGAGAGEEDVPVMIASTWASVTAGWQATCATTPGGVQPQCWGRNDHGKLGIGDDPAVTMSVNMPTDVRPPGL